MDSGESSAQDKVEKLLKMLWSPGEGDVMI